MVLSAQKRPMAPSRSKLPEITLAFWIVKISATTLGETAGDLLSMALKIGYTTGQARHSALQAA